MNILNLVRKNIKTLKPYSSARDEFSGKALAYLDANEIPYPSPYNRYPDPHQLQLKEIIAGVKNVRPEQILLGNGSDECIDLIIRAFCEPGVDNVLIPQPTYGMYSVCAGIHAVEVKSVLLDPDFDLDISEIEKTWNRHTKIIFLCSPNNPSGNLLSTEKVRYIIKNFQGLVVVDEAYIDFADSNGFLSSIDDYPNLAVLQTLSKAWGLAAIRLGMCFASAEIISILNSIKPPYNINQLTEQTAKYQLSKPEVKENCVDKIKIERENLRRSLSGLSIIDHVFPSDANFLLVKFHDAQKIFEHLISAGIIVRNRSQQKRCEQCLRITIGTPQENEMLLESLLRYEKSTFY